MREGVQKARGESSAQRATRLALDADKSNIAALEGRAQVLEDENAAIKVRLTAVEGRP